MKDYIEIELEIARKLFDLEKILEFQLKNDVQIIRGENYQYNCYINKKCYSTCLTMFGALIEGIERYNKVKDK